MKLIYTIFLLLLVGCSNDSIKPQNLEYTSITFSLSSNKISAGATQPLTLKGIYDINGTESQKILTDNITYQSSDESIAIITEDGMLKTFKTGEVTIIASYQNHTTNITLNIIQATLNKIEILPPTQAELSVLAERKNNIYQKPIRLKVLGHYDNNISQEITEKVTWHSNSSILETTKNGYLTTLENGEANLSVQFDGLEKSISFEIKSYDIVKYKIQNFSSKDSFPDKLSTHEGSRLEFINTPSATTVRINDYETLITLGLIGFYPDESNATLNPSWQIDNTNVSLSEGYLNETIGTKTLTAQLQNAKKDINITVTEPIIKYIHLTSNLNTTILNQTIDIELPEIYARYSNGTRQELTQNNISLKNLTPNLISLQSNTISTQKEGKAQIEVNYQEDGNIYAHIIPLHIGHITSIERKNHLFTLKTGETRTLGVSGYIDIPHNGQLVTAPIKKYTDLSSYVIWESLTTDIATVTQDGQVTGISEGEAILKAIHRTEEGNVTQTIYQNVEN